MKLYKVSDPGEEGLQEHIDLVKAKLQKEGEKVRSGLSDGSIQFEDQSGEAFKEEIAKRSEKLINKDLTKKQRESFVNRILRYFSVCFWIQGCSAPKGLLLILS